MLAGAALAAALAFAALSLLVMDRIYAEANSRALGRTALALAPDIPDASLGPEVAVAAPASARCGRGQTARGSDLGG